MRRKGDNERWRGGGELRGDMEVKWMVKYQKVKKTRRHTNLPPSSLTCDAVFVYFIKFSGILSDFMCSFQC